MGFSIGVAVSHHHSGGDPEGFAPDPAFQAYTATHHARSTYHFARKGFPPGQLGRLLALALEIDHNGLSGLLDPLRQAPPQR